MIGVERIESWRGQKVIDPDGEELGKLEEVWVDGDSGTPLLISVKAGLLGRRSALVPIDEAKVARDYVRVAYAKDAVHRAGVTRHGDQAPGREELEAVGGAYGLRFADRVQLRSASELERRRVEAEAARNRAEQLEAEAQEKAAAHQAARERAQSVGEDVGQAERESEEARLRAQEARQDADRYGEA